jgi:hypothetical protein
VIPNFPAKNKRKIEDGVKRHPLFVSGIGYGKTVRDLFVTEA